MCGVSHKLPSQTQHEKPTIKMIASGNFGHIEMKGEVGGLDFMILSIKSGLYVSVSR